MKPFCSVFIATSLDGFISRTDGNIDWLEQANLLKPDRDDCGYANFFATIDALVMGRNTFEQALKFPSWPYGSTPVYVLSSSLTVLPISAPESVELHSGSPESIVSLSEQRGHRRLYVDGGKTIQGFLKCGYITEITITVIPILLGTGTSLFGALPRDVRLKHISTTTYPFGFVQSTYKPTSDI